MHPLHMWSFMVGRSSSCAAQSVHSSSPTHESQNDITSAVDNLAKSSTTSQWPVARQRSAHHLAGSDAASFLSRANCALANGLSSLSSKITLLSRINMSASDETTF